MARIKIGSELSMLEIREKLNHQETFMARELQMMGICGSTSLLDARKEGKIPATLHGKQNYSFKREDVIEYIKNKREHQKKIDERKLAKQKVIYLPSASSMTNGNLFDYHEPIPPKYAVVTFPFEQWKKQIKVTDLNNLKIEYVS